jgi:hypothetical protein
MRFSENAKSLSRQHSRLVESPLSRPPAVQRHRHNQHLALPILSQLCNRTRKPRPEFA